MSYEYKRLRRDKASIIPIEETYTDLDINPHDDSSPAVGYRFDSPHRWVVSKSLNKAVGIRDLKLTPSSGDIRCKFLTFGKAYLRGIKYTWSSNKYVKATGSEAGSHDFYYGEYRCVSDDFNIQVTPENNLEEIITSMLDFINDASWKAIDFEPDDKEYALKAPMEHDTDRRRFYCTEDTTDNITTYEPLDYVYNINYLKIPLTFLYEYDSNTSNFNIKRYNGSRIMVMTDRSKSTNDVTKNGYRVLEFNDLTNYYYLKRNFTYSTRKKDTNNTNLDNVYLGTGVPIFTGYELLLIVRKDDVNSIKAVYDLYNQPMPNISSLPVINLEDGIYVIPFVNNEFESHFDYGTGTTKSNYVTVHDEPETNDNFIATNLKLDNVWDRLHLIYHASFADTRHRIIGRNGDHWDTPNKQFIVPTGDQAQFYLRFTTDGTHSILPIGCHFNVDLCFMLNPTSNTATPGNHDHFKD